MSDEQQPSEQPLQQRHARVKRVFIEACKLPPEQYQEALKEMLEEHGLNGQEYAAEIPEAMDKSAVSEPPEEEPAEARKPVKEKSR